MLSAAYINELQIQFIINYNRKSRQDEELERRTGEDTLKAQRDLMDRTLVPLGVPYDQLDEIGSGDKISTRPVFQDVIKRLNKGKYQAIAVKEISRMGRGSYTDMGIIYDMIVDKRIFIITPWKVYDPKNKADLRQIRFELFMSREEFETTRERLAGGRYTSAMAGKWVAGKAPFGYRVNKNTKKLEIHEEDAQIVRIIFDLFVNGIPDDAGVLRNVKYRALATYLRRIGVRTPNGKNEWRPDNLQYLLTNDVYIGVLRYRTTMEIEGKTIKRPKDEHIIVEDAHETLIDLDIWDKAQALAGDTSYTPRVKMGFKPYELTGLPVCAKCGRKMVRNEQNQKIRNKQGELKVYHKEFLLCSTSNCTMVKYRAVEESLLEVLRLIGDLDDEQIAATLKPLLSENDKPSKSTEDTEQFVERRKKELKHRMDFIYEKYETGMYTDEMFIERKAEIDLDLAKLENMQVVGDEKESNSNGSIDVQFVKNNIASVLTNYTDDADRADKNKVLRGVFEKVLIEVTEKGRGSTPSKFNIYPTFRLDFVTSDI